MRREAKRAAVGCDALLDAPKGLLWADRREVARLELVKRAHARDVAALAVAIVSQHVVATVLVVQADGAHSRGVVLKVCAGAFAPPSPPVPEIVRPTFEEGGGPAGEGRAVEQLRVELGGQRHDEHLGQYGCVGSGGVGRERRRGDGPRSAAHELEHEVEHQQNL